MLAPLLVGCGEAPPAMEIGRVAFAPDEVDGLSATQVELLAAVSALATGAAGAAGATGGDLASVGTPRLEAEARLQRIARLREEVILEGAGVTEAELEARYAGTPAYELEVRHFVILSDRAETSQARADARSRAEAGLQRVRGGEPFEDVVADLSEEPGAAGRGGLLRPGREGTWVDEFWAAASRLVEGGVSPVVESPFGFHVLRLESRRTLPFSDARPRVVREVAGSLGGGAAWEEARAAWVAELEIVPASTTPRPWDPSPLVLALGGPELVPDPEAPLARWPDGHYSAAEFRDHLLALSGSRLRQLGVPDPLEAELREAAERAYLDARALERGIQLGDEDRIALVRSWETEAAEWARVLGLSPELSPDELAAASLAALRITGQGATLARDAVSNAAPTLLGSVEIGSLPAAVRR